MLRPTVRPSAPRPAPSAASGSSFDAARPSRAAARRAALLVAVGAVAIPGALLPASPAQAKAGTCKHHSTEIARKGTSALWLSPDRKQLYACTSFYDLAPHDVIVGPWTKQSRFAFDGADVAWTTRVGGKDKVWVSDGSEKALTWLKQSNPAIGDSADGLVQKILVKGNAAAWVTTKGTVMMAVHSPDNDPSLIGGGTPGAAAPAGTSPTAPKPQGLSADPPKPQGHKVVVGRWGALDVATLAASLKITEGSGGDGDECGGTDEWEATVKPVAGQPRVGVDWYSSWSSTSGPCG